MENKEAQSRIAKENKKKLQETKQICRQKVEQTVAQHKQKHIDVKPHVDKYDKKITDMYDAYTIKEPELLKKDDLDKDGSFM
jgi:methyltransferase-like protein